jgi:hypothetical protein
VLFVYSDHNNTRLDLGGEAPAKSTVSHATLGLGRVFNFQRKGVNLKPFLPQATEEGHGKQKTTSKKE